ncbi:tetratricopeptide repeat protein [Streptomyces coelicoflavus]|uniref:tetratricopeptide repeat protein n=1 Tax=Streptomyces coelicoflavus TaxID=285562 RepID=UPI00210C62C4|nr:tetratricopeptide repeat protein [Streptomyces coelicoflavus]MCQ4205087.1 tetratricopeptide repeat protein [Streptomyces coelicoflavus]
MPRFSRSENKRRRNQAAEEQAPASGLKPIEVHVTADGRATVGGLPVVAGAGESVQSAVLDYLHRLVLATGHAVAATVHDERIGYLTPVRVEADGSSAFAGEPVPLPRDVMAAARAVAEEHVSERAQAAGAPAAAAVPTAAAVPDEHPVVREQPSTMPLRAVAAAAQPVRDKSTRALRAVPDPAPGAPLPAAREPERGPATAPVPAAEAKPDPRPGAARGETRPESRPEVRSEVRPEVRSEAVPSGRTAPVDPAPADPAPADVRSPSLLAEPVQRINEAVRMGRIESAAAMAEQTIASAVQRLGAEHPEVLQLRELAAYIAYLAGDAHRSFVLSMALARVRRGSDDQGAFGNVMSAAAAWRALRDPALGLALGHELIALWDAMAAAGGAAAADPSQLEAARTRMGRLAERARGVGEGRSETEGPRAQDR